MRHSATLASALAGTLAMMLATDPAHAGGQAGRFDYFVLSLGWSPSWCAETGDARHDRQCDAGSGWGFTLHGLWPQYESGWPEDCPTAARPPSRRQTAEMADIMGSAGLAWHEWKKHGTCSGLTAGAYFALTRRAYGQMRIPAYFSPLGRDLRIAPEAVEDAFIEANPGLGRASVAVACGQGRIDEVRICLTGDLQPRPCGADVARGCAASSALMERTR